MAADTFTSLLGLILMGTGNDNNNWGALMNASMIAEVELAIAGVNPQTVTGGTLDLSANPPPAGPSGAIHSALVLNGTLVSNQIVQVPNLTKTWLVQNNTAGAFTLTFKTPSGSASPAIQQNGGWQRVMCDGSNNITVFPFNTKRIIMPDGTVAAPPFSFANEPSGWYRAGSQDFRFSINGNDVMQITGSAAPAASVNLFPGFSFLQNGVQIVPSGAEMDYSGLVEPTGWYFTAGQLKNRTTDAALFAAIAPNTFSGVALTGNTHTSTTIDNLTVDLRGMGLIGAGIEGTGVITGTTITAIAASSLTLSQATSGTASGVSLRVSPYGLGDGSTTFKLPDRRGTAPFIRDDLNGTAAGKLNLAATGGIDGTKLSATGGEQAHTLLTAEIPAHAHPVFIRDPKHSHKWGYGLTPIGSTGSNQADRQTVDNHNDTSLEFTGIHANSVNGGGPGTDDATANAGGGGQHNVVPPATICNRLIKR